MAFLLILCAVFTLFTSYSCSGSIRFEDQTITFESVPPVANKLPLLQKFTTFADPECP